MSKTLTDHWVINHTVDDIEKFSGQWRQRALADLGGYDYFDITQFVRATVRQHLREGSTLQLIFWPKTRLGRPAEVRFSPLRLYIKADVWAAARDEGDPFARYVVAHECGHLILHDHEAQGFSSEGGKRIPIADQERSAEWQADRFADGLLAPIEIVERLSSATEVINRCGVPGDVAERRLREVSDHWLRHGRPCGLDCERCFAYDTQVIGSRMRCRQCGKTTRIDL